MATTPYHLTSNGPRVNTLVVDLANVPQRKITMDLIVQFIQEKLEIQFSNICTLQHNTGKSLVFIECETEEQALKAVDKNNGRQELIIDNVKYAINVLMEDGATTVRIHDISPQTENTEIESRMKKFGDILWIREEVWSEPAVLKGIKNGVRSVRIRMHTAVPSYININGQVTLVTYKHQQQTCRHCGKPVHWGRKCIEASYMELQMQGGNISDRLKASGVDYAGAVKQNRQEFNQNPIIENQKVGVNFTNLTELFRPRKQVQNNNVSQGQHTSHTKIDTNNDKTIAQNTITNTQPGSSKSRTIADSLSMVTENQSETLQNAASNKEKAEKRLRQRKLSNDTFDSFMSDEDMAVSEIIDSSSPPIKQKRGRSRKLVK